MRKCQHGIKQSREDAVHVYNEDLTLECRWNVQVLIGMYVIDCAELSRPSMFGLAI